MSEEEIIRIEDEAFNKKLLQTTTIEEYDKCYEDYLGESISGREIGFANNEVAIHCAKLIKEHHLENNPSAMVTLPDGRKVPISAHPPSKLKKE